MRPLDLFVEKQLCDRSVDQSSSRILSKEVNKINWKDWVEQSKTISTRDKMSLASASIILGSPFFLMTLGATFAVMDEIDNQRVDSELNRLFRPGVRTLAASQELTAEQELDAKIFGDALSPAAVLTLDQIIERATKPGRAKGDRLDQSVFTTDERRNYNSGFLSNQRNWLKASKVLKQKLILEDELERVNGLADFSLVAGIIANIELLNKDLKHLGC